MRRPPLLFCDDGCLMFAKYPRHQPPPRRRRNVRGSVLILVVSLLVLMALIGTAWISTTRVDRANAAQHERSTHADLLADGVVRMVEAELAADLFDGQSFR